MSFIGLLYVVIRLDLGDPSDFFYSLGLAVLSQRAFLLLLLLLICYLLLTSLNLTRLLLTD